MAEVQICTKVVMHVFLIVSHMTWRKEAQKKAGLVQEQNDVYQHAYTYSRIHIRRASKRRHAVAYIRSIERISACVSDM
jgi:hypothetical protein